jgi:hypothetical protein
MGVISSGVAIRMILLDGGMKYSLKAYPSMAHIVVFMVDRWGSFLGAGHSFHPVGV